MECFSSAEQRRKAGMGAEGEDEIGRIKMEKKKESRKKNEEVED